MVVIPVVGAARLAFLPRAGLFLERARFHEIGRRSQVGARLVGEAEHQRSGQEGVNLTHGAE
jgi:hypothetical protein